MINENKFGKRLAQLRLSTSTSARDMSLSLGQSESYINKIENGKSFPSMQTFFYICDFLKITPEEFFNYENQNSIEMKSMIENLGKLSPEQFSNISDIVEDLCRGK